MKKPAEAGFFINQLDLRAWSANARIVSRSCTSAVQEAFGVGYNL